MLFGLDLLVVHGEDAGAIVARHLQHDVDPQSEQFARLVRESATIIGANQGIKVHIETEQSRYPVHDALFLGAARNVSFNQEAFADKYPALFGYGHVLLVSDRVLGSPRVIYQLLEPTGYRPRMVAENGVSIAAAEYVNVGKWKDPEHLAEWIGEWTFEDTPEGPYLLSTVIGRETTGATTLRHVLGWVRIEPERLVPERFEAYDVPPGERRDAAHLKLTAKPERPAERVPDEAGAKVGAEWRRVVNATYEGDGNPVEVVHVGKRVKEYLKSAPLASQSRWWLQYELVDYTAARAWSNAGDYRKAYEHLVAEAATQQARGVPFLHNTRNHDSFALDMFVLHSAIMANTCSIETIPHTGYRVFEVSVPDGRPRFAFVFQPSGLEEYGVLVDNVDASEERWVCHVTKPGENGGYTPASRVYVVAKRGHFSIKMIRSEQGPALVFGGISKFVEYIGDHVPVVRSSPRSDIVLRIVGDDIEQPLQVLNLPSVVKDPPKESRSGIVNPDSPSVPEQSSQMPPAIQRNAPSNAKPLPAWLWPAAAVVLLAGASLWLNRKKLKRS